MVRPQGQARLLGEAGHLWCKHPRTLEVVAQELLGERDGLHGLHDLWETLDRQLVNCPACVDAHHAAQVPSKAAASIATVNTVVPDH